MDLHIDDERVLDLVRRAARVTGTSEVDVIELALIRLLTTYDAAVESRPVAGKIDAVQQWVAEYQADVRQAGEPRTVDELYDERTGLPA